MRPRRVSTPPGPPAGRPAPPGSRRPPRSARLPAPTLRRLALLVALAFAALASSSALAQGSAEVEVRVLLDEVASEVVVVMDEPHRGSVDGAPRFEAAAALAWPVRVSDDALYVDGRRVGRSLTLAPASGIVTWDGRAYRGALRLVADGADVQVINVLPLESYLRGVVPSEMQASWPAEALAAQAVAARTYTLASLDPEGSWDVCATIDCQVYRGVEIEHPGSDRAIERTAGIVLTYGGEFARTYYHADSGGAIASSQEVWGMALPYLPAQSDVRSGSPHRSWRRTFDAGALRAAAAAQGRDPGPVRSVRIAAWTPSGRVDELELIGDAGVARLSGTSLTGLLRGWGFKSTRFRMEGALTAVGDGWGHGVGMSQYGARALAGAGWSFDQILGYYYPATQLQRLAPY